MNDFSIGEVARQLSMSTDALRYYEKIGILPKINRTVSGIRRYQSKDISRLKFIKRAQRMSFTLAEIGGLLKMREAPQYVRTEVRQLTVNKLREIEEHLTELDTLRRELTLLVNLCKASEEDGCPIIDRISGDE